MPIVIITEHIGWGSFRAYLENDRTKHYLGDSRINAIGGLIMMLAHLESLDTAVYPSATSTYRVTIQ